MTATPWLLCLTSLSFLADTPRPEHPNILILLADDLRPDAIGALGQGVVKTPHLVALAKRSRVFQNAYNLGSNSPAVCLPSRNMLLSGRAYFRWKGPQAPADQPNLPDAFRAAGYETYHHGKRGNVALKIQEKFDVNKYVRDDVERTSGRPGQTIVDEAIDYLNTRTGDRPFLMYLAFEAPHDPRVGAPEDLALYDPSTIPLPSNYLPVHPFNNGEMTVRDERLAPWPREADEIRRQLRDYYAVMTGLDRNIGRLLTKLDELHLTDNTIVVFSADNGLALGSHGLMGKQSLYDHSAKVPLMIAGPRIPAGKTSALVYLLDLFPTLTDLAGLSIPSGLDGKSLLPVILGTQQAVRETLFTSYRNVQRAVRDDQYKLIRYPMINRTQLFDLLADPDERSDLSMDPNQAHRVEHLMTQLTDWQKRLGDSLPLTSPRPADPTFIPPRAEAPMP